MTATKSPLRQHSLRVLVPVPPKGIMVMDPIKRLKGHDLRRNTLNAPNVNPARHLAHARRARLLLQLRTVAAEIEQGDDTASPRLL